MNTTNSITSSNKYKHLFLQDYEFIIREVTKHDALHPGKKRNTGRTSLIRSLADQLSTSVSNIYSILKDASITVKDTNLSIHTELSPSAAFYKRSKSCKPSNALKLHKAQDFINLVCDEVLSNPLSSIDETIHSLILHNPERIQGMNTISTKTFYNYVHAGLIKVKPVHLPRTVQRKKQPNYKTYIPKRQKGTSIDDRPAHVLDRLEFGYWEKRTYISVDSFLCLSFIAFITF